MSNMLLYYRHPISASAVTREADGATFGSGQENLSSPDPKETYTFPIGLGDHTWRVDIDYGTAVAINAVLVGFLRDFRADAEWSISGGLASYTESALSPYKAMLAPSSVSSPHRQHAFQRLSQTFEVRYLRISVKTNSNAASSMGIVAAGLAFQPTFNREWGSGRQPIDTGSKEGLLGGGFGIGMGARKAGYRWTFGDLADVEIDTLYDLSLRAGETSPVVVVEDPDSTAGLNERIHYGLLDRFEAYERQSPGRTRWSLSMTEWV